MSVTNLTGTSWIIKEVPDVASFPFTWAGYITFIANGETFTSIERSGTTKLIFGSKTVYTVGGANENWPNYRNISIISGQYGYDTAANLISWLEANADLIELYYTDGAEIKSIADAIRAKGGTSGTFEYPNGFVTAIEAIETGITPAGTLTITENGDYDVTEKASARVAVKQWDDELIEILDGSATSLSGLPNVSKIKPYAFYQKTRQLPSIYQRVEYIESKGNACINTGITAKPPFKSTIDGIWGTYKSGFPTMLGTEDNKYNVMFGRGPNGFYIQNGAGSGIGYLYSTHAPDSNRHTFETEVSSTTSTIRVDDTVDSINYTHAQLTSNPMFLFARGNKTSSFTTSDTLFRLYSFELINDGELVWSAIPCYRKIDGVIGLYNAVDNRFYENIGTEAFIKGENININGETVTVETADLSVTEIGAYAFYNNELSSLTLRANQVVTLGEGALEGTPIADGTGHVYVNADLVDAYKSDSAWATYASVIEARTE